VTDSFNCPATSASVTITVHPVITANAGADKVLCSDVAAVNLAGSVQNATSGIWSGGNGNYNPSNTSLNVAYTPTASERSAGYVNLVLQTTGNGGCPPAYDTVRVSLPSAMQLTMSLPGNTTLCTGTTTNLSVTTAGGVLPYQYLWNTGQQTQSIVAGAGTFTVTVIDSFQCAATSAGVTITVHPVITANAGADRILCSDAASVNLNGSVQNATGGLWSGGGGTFSPSNTSLNGSYTPTSTERSAGFVNLILQTTGNGGCQPVFDTVRVSLPSSMQVTLSQPNTVLCNGTSSINLSVSAAGGIAPYQYLWNTGQQTQGIVAGAGTYTVTVTDQASCSAVSSSVTVTVLPAVTANAGSNMTLCSNGNSVNLNGSIQNATGGLWSGGSGTFSPSNTSLNVSYTPSAADRAAGFVNLVLETTGNGGCPPAYDTVRVDLPSALQITLSQPSTTLCNGASNINLSATAVGGILPYTYRWNTGQTTPGIVAGAGTYTVTVMDAASCSNVSSSVTIAVQPPLIANAGSPVTICPNTPGVNLNGSIQNAGGGIWRGGNGVFDPENIALNAIYTPTALERAAGFVNLVLQTTGNGGCPAVSDTVLITLAPQPSPSITGSVILCANTSVNYSVPVQSGNSYFWSATGGVINGSPTSNTTNITWSNTGNGTVVITETNTFGCSATNTLNISMVPVPNPVISGSSTLCQYTTETYSVTSVPGNTYVWDVNGGVLNGPANGASVAVNWNSNGTGNIRVTERNPFGCEQSFQVPVTVKERPVPVISGSSMGCTGTTYTYTTPVSANTNYLWSVTGGSLVAYNGANSVNVTWNNSPVHSISLTAINTMTGCDSAVVFNVQVAPITPPVIQAPLLNGCPPLSIHFTGNVPSSGQTYAWSFGDEFFSSSSTPTHIYETPGTFNLVLITRNNTGCVDTATATITVYPVPVASFTHNFESNPYYAGEDTLSLTNNSTGATNYLWTFGTADTANAFEPNYSFHDPGDYVLKLFAINEFGCVDKSLSYIRVRVREQFYVPNAFSPNGDNINDYFYVESENIASMKILIFNRWGRIFYTSNDKNFRWDGTCQGDPVPLGVYGFLLTAIGRNGTEQKMNGTVTIVR
jgi:gliding motility-associated-like protein